VVESAARSETPRLASRRRNPATSEFDRFDDAFLRVRVCDVDSPGPTFGRGAPDADVAAQIDDCAAQRGPRATHCGDSSRCGETFADPAEVDPGSSLNACASCGDVYLKTGGGPPPVERLRRLTGK
jgi:hypothetical protein